jgi:hypothetical protein
MDTQVADNGAYVGTGGSAGPSGPVIGPSERHKPSSQGPRRCGQPSDRSTRVRGQSPRCVHP